MDYAKFKKEDEELLKNLENIRARLNEKQAYDVHDSLRALQHMNTGENNIEKYVTDILTLRKSAIQILRNICAKRTEFTREVRDTLRSCDQSLFDSTDLFVLSSQFLFLANYLEDELKKLDDQVATFDVATKRLNESKLIDSQFSEILYVAHDRAMYDLGMQAQNIMVAFDNNRGNIEAVANKVNADQDTSNRGKGEK